jgi:hypothetical protein
MSRLNTSSSHPLIPSAQQYVFEKKYVSISSQDRDILKHPLSSVFEIELPQDYLNVQSVRLATWTFPSNYYIFSELRFNTSFVFKITEPYNPNNVAPIIPLQVEIFNALNSHIDQPFIAIIQDGTYTPFQIATELTNKMNKSVTNYIIEYLTEFSPTFLNTFLQSNGYAEFVVVYNSVSLKLNFGNKSSGFSIDNDSPIYENNVLTKNTTCINKNMTKQYINWGLPWYLGFSFCAMESFKPDIYDSDNNLVSIFLPRFEYGDASSMGDNGYWLIPSLPGASVYYLETPSKINILGDNYFYMDIAGLNSIDITEPYNTSYFTTHTNQTNGVVNSCFAKISLPAFPNYLWLNNLNSLSNQLINNNVQHPYKYFNPPAERIRKMFIKIIWHDGTPVYFANCDFSFTIELGLITPQNKRDLDVYVPEAVAHFF